MYRSIAMAALLLAATATAALATESPRDVLNARAAKVAQKHKLCSCDAAQFYGRIGELRVQLGNSPTAYCAVSTYDAFGQINGGASCFLFTVLP